MSKIEMDILSKASINNSADIPHVACSTVVMK